MRFQRSFILLFFCVCIKNCFFFNFIWKHGSSYLQDRIASFSGFCFSGGLGSRCVSSKNSPGYQHSETMCQFNLRTLPIDSLLDLWDSIGVEGNTPPHPMINDILESLPQFILEMDADWEMVCDFVLSQDPSMGFVSMKSESQWLAVEKVFLEEIDA